MNLKKNIYSLYVLKVSQWLLLTMPVMLIFYNANHLTVKHLFTIQAVYSLAIVILEIPSGYMADVWGRKNTIIIGAVLGFIGYFIYSVSSGFWYFMFAEIILGIGSSFISGTDTALLYDTLLSNDLENQYIKIEGRMTSVGNFAEAISGVASGFLAAISLRLPFICQAIAALIAIPAAIAISEPVFHKQFKKPTVSDVIASYYDALFKNKKLMRNMMLSSVVGASTLTMAWFVQPYFKTVSVPISLYGILWTILNASVGLAALAAYRIERKFGEAKTSVFIVICLMLGYISLAFSHSVWAISIILFFYLIRGIATPVLKDYINKQIASETRATVLSLRNLIIRGLFSMMAPIFGWLTDKISLQAALLMAGSTYFIFSLPFILMYWKFSSRLK